MHAAAVSYVLMADQGDTFKRLYKEAGQDLGNETVLATVDAEGRLLEDYFLEPKELIHFTDSGQAALFCHSCLSMVRGEWCDGIQRCRTELVGARG